MSNDDLAAVREFRADLDEPREGALAKGRWQLAGSPERPHRKRAWMLATAGAAVAVALVVGGVATIGRPQQHQAPEQSVVAGSSATTTTTKAPGTDLPVAHGTKAPMNPVVTGRAGGSHARAVEALTRLAAKQTGGPLAIGADQVLYVKSYSLTDGEGRYIHEAWMDVTIGAALRVRRTDESPRVLDITLSQAEIDRDAGFAAGPPGITNLNGAYVATFPTSAPAALAATWKTWAQQEYPGRNADAMIFERLHSVFHYVEPLLTAAQRGTLYLALAELPSTQATTATIAGKQYDAVCVPDQAQGTRCALFDPATGRYTGDASTGTDLVVKAGHFDLVDVGVQPRPAPDNNRTFTSDPKDLKPTGSATTPKR